MATCSSGRPPWCHPLVLESSGHDGHDPKKKHSLSEIDQLSTRALTNLNPWFHKRSSRSRFNIWTTPSHSQWENHGTHPHQGPYPRCRFTGGETSMLSMDWRENSWETMVIRASCAMKSKGCSSTFLPFVGFKGQHLHNCGESAHDFWWMHTSLIFFDHLWWLMSPSHPTSRPGPCVTWPCKLPALGNSKRFVWK